MSHDLCQYARRLETALKHAADQALNAFIDLPMGPECDKARFHANAVMRGIEAALADTERAPE